MRLFSKVFEEGGTIPTRYNFDMGDATLPLEWSEIPEGVQSLVLVCDDPDADVGTWGHWVLFNIPPTLRQLPDSVVELPPEVRVGKNQLSRREYVRTERREGLNRYFFSLYALDCTLDLKDGTSKKDILQAVEGHVIDDAQLLGCYAKPSPRPQTSIG